MKKNYIQPAVEIEELVSTTLLAGSGLVINDGEETVSEGLSTEFDFNLFSEN